jgi:hypothetical protein
MVYNTAYFAKRIATGATSGQLVGGLSVSASGVVTIPQLAVGSIDMSGVDIATSYVSADYICAASGLLVAGAALKTTISGSAWAATCSGSAGFADFGDVSGALTDYATYTVVSGAITAATSGLVGYDVVSGACTSYTSGVIRSNDISSMVRFVNISSMCVQNDISGVAHVVSDISGYPVTVNGNFASVSGSAWSATTSGAAGYLISLNISGMAHMNDVSGLATLANVSGYPTTVEANISSAIAGYSGFVTANYVSGFITANYVSGFAHMNDLSSMVVANSISSMVVASEISGLSLKLIAVDISGIVRNVDISGMAHMVDVSGLATLTNISGMINTVSGYSTLANISGLGLWTSSVQTIYEVSAAGWDSCSGADFPAGATTTASSAVDVSSPSLTAVAMISGQAVAMSVFVPSNANRVSQRLVARHYTSGPTATFTTYQRTIGGSWSGILTTTISGTLLYRTTVVSSDIAATLPISAGAVNQFVVGVACSGTVYLNDYQLNFS